MSMPRSTRAGELSGPADTARQVRWVTLVVFSPARGVLVLQQPDTGLVAIARTQPELARAIGEAFTEVQCAAYSAWRRGPVVRRTTIVASATLRRRRDVHDEWKWVPPTPQEPGIWRSPTGRRYPEGSAAVQSVLRKRGRL